MKISSRSVFLSAVGLLLTGGPKGSCDSGRTRPRTHGQPGHAAWTTMTGRCRDTGVTEREADTVPVITRGLGGFSVKCQEGGAGRAGAGGAELGWRWGWGQEVFSGSGTWVRSLSRDGRKDGWLGKQKHRQTCVRRAWGEQGSVGSLVHWSPGKLQLP